ncbi:MAG TPA: ATP-binding protein [Mariprofundaceae bacterium]|nr:ATP-binding protein [Mariprofundaceae bacterium]
MNDLGVMRFLPIVISIGMLVVAVALWPSTATSGDVSMVVWLNITLLLTLSAMSMRYGVRLLRERQERRPGSRLRAKLVMGLVGMLLVPAIILQFTASQMVDRGLDVWFDVRVDTLLDRTLNLARDFYARVETDLKQGMLPYMDDSALLEVLLQKPIDYNTLTSRLADILSVEGWQRLQVFDVNERLLAGVQANGLSDLEAAPLGENAKLAVTLGRVVTELQSDQGREVAVGYAPLRSNQGVVGLLRAEIRLPTGAVQNARAVESDYKKYRELERNRQAIRALFTNTMLIVTLLVVMVAGWVALIFARRLTAPIGGLAEALRRVTEGDLDVTIKEAPRDELGSLVRSFNRMAFRLRENVQALQQTQRDLTEALDSNRHRRQILETLLANLQTGVLLVDADAYIRLLNESLRELLALPSGWMVGRDLTSLCSGRLHAIGGFFEELCYQDQDHLQRELDITVGKQHLHILVRGARLGTAGAADISGYLIVFDDVSSLAEAQRHRAWAEVARRLAHEIKNPLTPIKLATERLQRRFGAKVDDGAVFDTCTSTIIGQVERLQRLIGDFSMLARLPKPRLKEEDVRDILHEMRDLYLSYDRVRVAVPDTGPTCMCDADQVRQVLINLLDNALAATAGDYAPVELYVGQVEDAVEFHVLDEGEGIPESSREHLFEAYFSTKPEGSGLGLAIARRIAEEHEGELLALSYAHPTHFCLRLPLQGGNMEMS